MFVDIVILNESKRSLPKKKVNVKSYITKKGKFVSTYQRNQHYNPNNTLDNQKESYNKEVSKLGFADNKIKNIKKLSNKKSGITSGIVRFEVNDEGYYFKPNSGESQFKKTKDGEIKRVRDSIFLYDKKTGKKTTIDTKIKKSEAGKYRGWMANREEIAYIISKQLGLDHVPPTLTRRIKGKTGVVVSDVYSHFKDKYSEIIDLSESIFHHRDAIYGLAKADKRLHDKILFDYIIGNTDRHERNLFIGKTKDKKYEIIAFDHGLAFPSDNKLYALDLAKRPQLQLSFNKLADGALKISDEFATRFTEQVNSSAFDEIKEMIEIRIGPSERKAFEERVNKIKNKIKKARKR